MFQTFNRIGERAGKSKKEKSFFFLFTHAKAASYTTVQQRLLGTNDRPPVVYIPVIKRGNVLIAAAAI
jgi:hypothetical protein